MAGVVALGGWGQCLVSRPVPPPLPLLQARVSGRGSQLRQPRHLLLAACFTPPRRRGLEGQRLGIREVPTWPHRSGFLCAPPLQAQWAGMWGVVVRGLLARLLPPFPSPLAPTRRRHWARMLPLPLHLQALRGEVEGRADTVVLALVGLGQAGGYKVCRIPLALLPLPFLLGAAGAGTGAGAEGMVVLERGTASSVAPPSPPEYRLLLCLETTREG
jgi:hypothetical protein